LQRVVFNFWLFSIFFLHIFCQQIYTYVSHLGISYYSWPVRWVICLGSLCLTPVSSDCYHQLNVVDSHHHQLNHGAWILWFFHNNLGLIGYHYSDITNLWLDSDIKICLTLGWDRENRIEIGGKNTKPWGRFRYGCISSSSSWLFTSWNAGIISLSHITFCW